MPRVKLGDEEFEICNNLMWSNSQRKGNWYEAIEFAKNCRDGGLGDWRLPTVEELREVYDYKTGELRIDGWEGVGYFWSSTEPSSDPTRAWRVYLTTGHTYYGLKTSATVCVRCVRRLD